MEHFLLQAFIYLSAAVVLVPIAKFLNLGSVLGYLIAGILIGPVFGFVGAETEELQHFAEFGVVMMLFLIGLELEPHKVWQLRHRLLGMGGLQVVATTAVIALLCWWLDFPLRTSVVIGLMLALSSTAIVLQTLSEKGIMNTVGGQSSFSVLLFQDIAVIPILAIIPLLAMPEVSQSGIDILKEAIKEAEAATKVSVSIVDGIPPIARTLMVFGAVGGVVVMGRYLVSPAFSMIARAALPELFTFAALLLIVGIALLMYMVGLSPALGAFMAGVMLANSQFRHELESTVEPFKGILLGLFFITVGARIDFGILSAHLSTILLATLGLMLLKALILLGISFLFQIQSANRWLFTMALAQAGEFGFVLLSYSEQNSALSHDTGKLVALIIAISMLLTPILFIVYEKWIEPIVSQNDEQVGDDEIDMKGKVILIGAGRFGQIIYRLLHFNKHDVVVVDNLIRHVNLLREFGYRAYYGDPEKPELLKAAGIDNAELFIVTINDPDRSLRLVRYVRKHHPTIKIFARAMERSHYYALRQAGADVVIRDTFHSSLLMSQKALAALGMHEIMAKRQANLFRDMDEQHLEEMIEIWQANPDLRENSDYRSAAIKANELLKEALEYDRDEAEGKH